MFDTGSSELEELCSHLKTANRGLQQKAFFKQKKKGNKALGSLLVKFMLEIS